MRLYRPVGSSELNLIKESGWEKFPPRLPSQPIFYPVCYEEYARQIAERWNRKEGHDGFVVAFDVDDEYIAKHEKHTVGSRIHTEYWIPAEEMDEFNEAITSPTIRLIYTANGHDTAVVVLMRDHEDGKVLGVTRRGTTDQWGLPGGKVDKNEFFIDAAWRELHEETGLRVNRKVTIDGERINSFQEVFRRECGPGFDGKSFNAICYEVPMDVVYPYADPDYHTRESAFSCMKGDAGDVDWITWDKLFQGPFAEYNKQLYEAVKDRPIPKLYDLKELHTKQLMMLLQDARVNGWGYTGGSRYFKTNHGFCITIDELKAELATREHIPTGKERKMVRQKKAKQQKTMERRRR